MMKSIKKSSWPFVVVLIFISLTAITCDGTPTSTIPTVEQACHGDLYVEDTDVARVTPQPVETYQLHGTYTWKAPFGIEVTAGGEGILQVYDSSNSLLSKFSVYAASTTSGQATVQEWDGSKTITFNAGNFYVKDDGGQTQCKLNLLAQGVGITSVGTEYLITVRPDLDEVIVAVLDGVVNVTSKGVTVTLDAQDLSNNLVVISHGDIGPLLPVPDPERLREDVINGGNIVPEIPGETPQIPESLTLWADEQLLPVLQELGKRFEADTGIRVLIEGMPLNEIKDRFIVATDAGNTPDLLTLSHTQIYDMVGNNLLLPVEPGTSPDLLVPGTIQAFSVNGVNYGAPYVYTNLALVSNPGYVPEIPPTWSELSRFAYDLSFGREFFTSLMIPADGYHFYPVQSAFGGYVFGTSREGGFNPQDIGMDSNGSLAAATWLEELVNSQPFFTGDEEAALQNFLGGNAAMILTGPWSLPRLHNGDMPYQINPFPREVQDSQPFLDVDGFVVSSASQAPDYAQEFILRYLTTSEAMQAYSRILQAPPARRDALENLEDPDVRAFGFAGVNGIPIPNIPEMNSVWDPWTNAILAIIERTKPADAAFNDAASQIRQSLNP
jgi:maltose/maltodextrin transport system substrate-binding protein/arabinogalactan oligomer/maltooligosaccharide transport system substrate-binding protein